MKVLLVDDDQNYGRWMASALNEGGRISVTYVNSPPEVRELDGFDVVVVDLLFRNLKDEFDQRLSDGRVKLYETEVFLVSGLQTLTHISEAGGSIPRSVVWTIMEDNRALHVIYAYQELGVRVFCAKGALAPTGRGGVERLASAIGAAADGRHFHDEITDLYIPRRRSELPSSRPHPGDAAVGLADTFFREARWRSAWRGLALGHSSEQSIARALGYHSDTRLRGNFKDMHLALHAFNPGVPLNRQHAATLASYAREHWQFFLDDSVMRRYPPELHPWSKGGDRHA